MEEMIIPLHLHYIDKVTFDRYFYLAILSKDRSG